MTRWFTADLHLGHANIIKHCERPWEDVQQMDDALIANVNASVAPSDELWVLGDFSMRPLDEVRAYRERIECRNVYLVRGNHDKDFGPSGQSSPWSGEWDYHVLKGERRLVLFHYPIVEPEWAGGYHGSIHLHGHIHARPAYNEAQRAAGTLRYDVGVDANGYAPVSERQLYEFFGL